MGKPHKNAIHWFRRDLRITDNTALSLASKESDSVTPVYIVSDWQKSHLWTGPPRQEFLCGCLEALARNLTTIGGRLIIRQGPAEQELEKLIKETEAEAIYFNRDPDPFGQACQKRVQAMAEKLGIACVSQKDVVLHEPEEVLKPDGLPYRVFTPYSKRWLPVEKPTGSTKPKDLNTPAKLKSLPLPTLATWGLTTENCVIPIPGERAAQERMKQAFSKRLPKYSELRDHPAVLANSGLSQDLRFGTISIRKLYQQACKARDTAKNPTTRSSYEKFISELAWREFYMQILFHFPEVLELEFNSDHRGLPWDEPGAQFEAWKNGQTGFPIVDAGMRELAQTGLMHNRVRMIVAMFLTKDLHIDWRLGEQFFMQSLVDGEIASNNGGWQWSAGTGADAAPYFRIQNPWTQTKRYDSKGEYIKKWVPELANVPAKELYTPPPAGESIALGYAAPIVDHKTERERTLAIFKKHLAQKR